MLTVMFSRCTPATECLLPTIIKQIEEMFLNIGFSQVVAEKLVNDQRTDSPWILASLSDEDICDVTDGLVGGKLLTGGIKFLSSWQRV